MTNEIDTLEDLVKKPKKIKRPSNAALWVAYIFFNVTILIFDGIASATVYSLTQNIGYAVVTFLAGFLPLLMHEFLYLRAYASQWQRYISIGGAVLAALTVAVVAVLAAGVNVAIASGYSINQSASELVILLIIVVAALIHTVLAAAYFYLDEGIRATHAATENLAWHESRMKNLDRAEQVLEKAHQMRTKKANLVTRFGGEDGKKALELLLSQFNDDDGDGIANILDAVDNRKQSYAQNAPRVELKEENFTPGANGNHNQTRQ